MSSALLFSAGTATALDIPLGGIGGVGDIVPGTGLISVTSVINGGPGDLAGLQAGDLISGADGITFSPTSTDAGAGFVGAVQDLAMAVDRAEGNGGALSLRVIRSGAGGIDLNLTLNAAGTLGPAWPANQGKTADMFEWCCDQIHSKVQSSSSGDFGYNSGWFGIILLSHPDWNQTTGANPFRNSINKLRTRCEDFINGRVLEPQEAYYFDGSNVVSNPGYVSPGLENWDVCTSAMFLALYRSKTGDTSVDAEVQTAAEAIANRIQSWKQYDDNGALVGSGPGGGLGRMGHGGVHGDYSHYNGVGALNIINAHALPALALLKNAGANMSSYPAVNPNNLSVNSQGIFSYEPEQLTPTIEGKFRICWDYVKAATTNNGGSDDGNVGYVGKQSGWDSAGRTPGCFAGWHLYGMAANADDTDKAARQADYFTRRWYRQQHAHAYTLGGVALSQLAMPFLDDRRERFFQENTRLYPALARKPDGSIAYFPGRQNNGGDGYLNYNNVAIVNAAIPIAIRTGNLPGFPAPDTARIHAWMRSPVNSWPAIEARRAVLTGLSHSLDVDITDVDGTVLAPAGYTASWTNVSGPAAVSFGSPSSADTTVTFPQAGTYRVNLEVTRGSYVLNEPYDLVVSTTTPPADVAPYIVAQPADQTADQGESVTFTVTAQGTAPLVYQWRRNGVDLGSPSTEASYTIDSVAAGSVGDYECVITNAAGTVTSAAATLTVNGVGTFRWGGLWRDVFTGIGGSYVSDLTSSVNFPSAPDASGVIETPEGPTSYGDNYGQRWSGWITPPETGSYRFYIASDDESELWLSTGDTRAGRQRIARVSDGNDANGAWWTDPRQWNKFSSQTSAPVSLTGGQRYYIEVLQKEGGGGDNLAVTWNWQSPGVWATPANGSPLLPGAILEYQEGGTIDDAAHPPANYPPVAYDQSLVVYGGDFTDVELDADDFEQSPLSFSVVEGPAKGTLSGTAPDLVYTPFPGASGIDSFTFVANDGSLDSEPATITFSLIPESGTDLQIWDGSGDNLWSNTGNWLSGTAPDSADAVIFNGDSLSNLATSLDGNRSVSRVVVESPAGPVTIADNTLTLGGGIEMLPATTDLTISSAVALAAAQEWSVGAGRTLVASGALSGSTVLTKTGPGTLRFSAVGTQTGGIEVNGGTVEIAGGGWYAGYVAGSGMLTVNEGATAINVNAHSFGNGNNPTRDLTLNGGSFLLQAETYIDDIWATAGYLDYTIGGGGDLRSRSGNNSVLTVNAADEPTIINCQFNSVGTWVVDVADGAAYYDLAVTGPLTGGATLTKNGTGRMFVSSTCTHSGALNVTAGELALTGSLGASSAVTIQSAAALTGTGVVGGTLAQSGTVSPGIEGVAVLTIGTLNQNSGAITAIELNGSNPGSGHDQIAVVGAANLAGTLDVALAPGYLPDPGDVFDVVTCASRTGTFSSIQLPVLPPDRTWTSAYDTGSTPGLRLAVEAVALPEYTLSYVAGANGSVSGASPQTVVQGGDGSEVIAVPNAGHHFVSWSDGLLTTARTDTNIQDNLSVTATFAINQYTATYNSAGNGSISGVSPQTIDHGADASTVTAIADPGYHFVSWSDGVLTAARTDTNVLADLNVTATFAINQYTLTYTADSNGSISGTTPQTVDHGSDASMITAVPDEGYHFVSWSDGVLTAERTDTGVLADINVTATFALDPYDEWISGFPSLTTPAETEPGEDPDGDGLANAIEFVLGRDPSQADPGDAVVTSVGATDVTFEFERVTAAGDAGFDSVIEFTEHPGVSPWTDATPGMISIADHGATETVTVTVPRTGADRMFGRLKVLIP
ncbi:MAG: immunoglobulin domain-containing protein [Akkermansiaceae bacterium]|nr:immunoglobulin domain-containing protein [Akkermansiaceae bacterium]